METKLKEHPKHVYFFKPQFVPLVKGGAKLQTFRPMRKRMPEEGDTIDLRTWTGKPYRSKQERIGTGVICEVGRLIVSPRRREIITEGLGLVPSARENFYKNDGFDSWDSFYSFFEREYKGKDVYGFATWWRRRCRVCGYTDLCCTHCIVRTGEPLHWVEYDLCSSCERFRDDYFIEKKKAWIDTFTFSMQKSFFVIRGISVNEGNLGHHAYTGEGEYSADFDSLNKAKEYLLRQYFFENGWLHL